MCVEEMVTPEGRLFELVVPEWLRGMTLGNDRQSGLHLWYQHGVLVLRVDDNWDPNPMVPFIGGERLLVGFTSEALSGMVQPPQDSVGAFCDWVSVNEWLHTQGSLSTEPVPLIAITYRDLEDKQLAAINLRERFEFSPKVIGILRTGSAGVDEVVTWFPGGSDFVRPGDKLLCHADMIDVQLLQLQLNVAFQLNARPFLRKKLFQIRTEAVTPTAHSKCT